MPHFLIRSTVLTDRRLPLPGKVIVIGRSLDADVPIPHKSVSRRHALLEQTESGYVISDLGSSNGTFVDGLRVYPAEKAVLPLGRTFALGEVKIVLAPDEVIGEDGPPPQPPNGPARRSDGSLTLAQAPKPAPPPPVSAGALTAGNKPRPAVKARIEQRKAKKAVTRLIMAVITVVLLALAAFFVYRIVANQSRGPLEVPPGSSPEGESERKAEPPPKKPEVRPILIDEGD